MPSTSATLPQTDPVATTALHRLRLVLKANAAFSLAGGVAALVAAPWISDEFGIDHVAITRAIGAGLVLFAVFVAWVAHQPEPLIRREALAISVADAAWVIASVAVVATGMLTTLGVIAILAIAVAVGDFGVMQFLLRRASQSDSSPATR